MIKNLSVIIATYNEEIHLERLLKQISNKVRNIYIIDSYSTDKTIGIAKKYNCKIYKKKFINHSIQINYLLKKIKLRNHWILRLDADEIIENNFFKKFEKIINLNNYNGLIIKREYFFLGKKIKYGGVYPLYEVRIWKNKRGYYDNRAVDEKIVIHKPKIYKSNLIIIDKNLKSLKYWLSKHFRYAQNEAMEYLKMKTLKSQKNSITNIHSKRAAYYKFPIFLRAFLLLLYRYIYKKGFLDGLNGILYNLLQTLYYRLLVDLLITFHRISLIFK